VLLLYVQLLCEPPTEDWDCNGRRPKEENSTWNNHKTDEAEVSDRVDDRCRRPSSACENPDTVDELTWGLP